MLHHRFARVKPTGLTPAIALLAGFRRRHKLPSATQPRLTPLIIKKLISSRIILIVRIIERLLVILIVVVIVLVILIILILSVAIIRLIIPVLPSQSLLFVLLINLELLSPRYKSLRRRPIILVLVPGQVLSHLVKVQILPISRVYDSLQPIMCRFPQVVILVDQLLRIPSLPIHSERPIIQIILHVIIRPFLRYPLPIVGSCGFLQVVRQIFVGVVVSFWRLDAESVRIKGLRHIILAKFFPGREVVLVVCGIF